MASTDTSPGHQEREIEKLKGLFPNQVRVIRNLGEFNYVVNIHPDGLDMNIKFQLKEQYPQTIPNIFVKVGNTTDGGEGLARILTRKAQSYVGSHMMEQLIHFAIEQIDIMGLDVQICDKIPNKSKQKGKKKHGKKKKLEEEEEDKKKVSMKTAGDVISRILWDESLPSDQFTVGYMDRFIGMVEKNFSAFSWEDLASVDYTVLAIPKHRIHYFKYKDIKVWDKDKRMDNVFGSTGSNLNIMEVMGRYDADRRAADAQNPGIHDCCTSGPVDGGDSGDSEDDSDSDDGIQVTIGRLDEPSGILNEEQEDMAQILNASRVDTSEYWEDKLRANYFLAVRITDSEIISNVETVRSAIVKAEPRYEECCIPNCSLHITLCVIRLDTPENVQNAIQVLKKARLELARMAPKGKALKLEGVSNFYDRVIYAKVHYPPEFLEFVDHLKMCLWEGGISNKDGYEFVAHMTIMKVSRPVARVIGTAKVNPRISAAHADMYFGTQNIGGVHLCAMGEERGEDGFYVSPVAIDFGLDTSTSSTTSSCPGQLTLSDSEYEDIDIQLQGVTEKVKQSCLSDKIRSNYFLTVKIDNPEIVRNVEAFQTDFRSRQPIFQDFCIPPQELHVTFGTLLLTSQEEVTKAKDILACAASELSSIFSKDMSIKIEGLGVFFDRVVYSRVNYPPQFLEYLSNTVKILVKAGFAVREKENYTPHLTLVRVSQQDARVRKLGKLECKMFENWTETKFGCQSNINVHVCPVGKLSRIGVPFSGI